MDVRNAGAGRALRRAHTLVLTASLLAGVRDVRGVPLEFERLSLEDGLSHTAVTAIEQDRRGFLWVGTNDGLNRYDGYGFKVYRHNPEDGGTLADNAIESLCIGRRDELWVGTFGGGLHRFQRDDETFERWLHDPENGGTLSHDTVRALLEDRGVLWIGTEAGLDRFEPERRAFARIPREAAPSRPGGATVYALAKDRAGELWVGTGDGLLRLDRDSGLLRRPRLEGFGAPPLEAVKISAIARGAGEDLWVATATDGLYRFDPESGVDRYRHQPGDGGGLGEDVIKDLLVDRSGELWIATETRGLSRFDRSSGAFSHARYDPFDAASLSDDGTLELFEDRTGILWIGTHAGLSKYYPSRQQFVTYRQRPGDASSLSGRGIGPILEDRSGTLWVGSWDRGLDRIARESDERDIRDVVNYTADPEDPDSLPHAAVTALAEDRTGALWVGTWDGLGRFDDARGGFDTYRHDPADPTSLRESGIAALWIDGSSRLWVGTYSGLDRLEEAPSEAGARFVHYPLAPDHPPGLGRSAIFAFCEDPEGAIWVGSESDGIYRIRPDERVQHFRHDPADRASLSSNQIASLHVSRPGTVWIGTWGGGLNRFDGGTFTRFSEREGLPSASVLAILEDDESRLWLSTNRGLSRFDPSHGTFRNYGVDDGLQGAVYTAGSAFRSPSGEMFFGGVQGFDAFFPEDVRDDPHPPPVVITDFQLFNRSVPFGSGISGSPLARSILEAEEVVLTYRDDVFGFEFAALHFGEPDSNRYAYRLEGFDRDWVFTDASKRFAQYSNLDAGDYVFRVKASNGDGVWNEQGASIRITIRPPWWKSSWAYVLYALAGVALVGGGVHWQRSRVERERAAHRERAVQLLERQQLIDELQAVNAELQAVNAELKSFTYTVSHDLKSPLVTVMGFLGFLRRDLEAGKTDRAVDDIQRIEAAAQRIETLLDDLLELSRIGRMVNPPETLPVSELASEAARRMAEQSAERGVVVVVDPGLPAVSGDRARLLQVFQNLFENAVKYAGDQPSPQIEVGARRDATGPDGRSPVFYVRDNGIGIAPEHHERVFGLFQQLDADAEGTGVGLALVKRIIEFHDGRVWVESEGHGCGSTFCFTLPCQE